MSAKWKDLEAVMQDTASMVQAVKNQVELTNQVTKSEASCRKRELDAMLMDAEEIYVMIGRLMDGGASGFTLRKLRLSYSAPDHGLFDELRKDTAGFSTKEEWLSFLSSLSEQKGYNGWLAELLDRLCRGCMVATEKGQVEAFRAGTRAGSLTLHNDRAWAQQKLAEAERRHLSASQQQAAEGLAASTLGPTPPGALKPLPYTDFASAIAALGPIPPAPSGVIEYHRDVAVAAATEMMLGPILFDQRVLLDRSLVESQQHEARDRVREAYGDLAKAEHHQRLGKLQRKVNHAETNDPLPPGPPSLRGPASGTVLPPTATM